MNMKVSGSPRESPEASCVTLYGPSYVHLNLNLSLTSSLDSGTKGISIDATELVGSTTGSMTMMRLARK